VDGWALYNAYMIPGKTDPTGTKTKCTLQHVGTGYTVRDWEFSYRALWSRTYTWEFDAIISDTQVSARSWFGYSYVALWTLGMDWSGTVSAKASLDLGCYCNTSTDSCEIYASGKPLEDNTDSSGDLQAVAAISYEINGDTAKVTVNNAAAYSGRLSVTTGATIGAVTIGLASAPPHWHKKKSAEATYKCVKGIQ